MKYNIGNTTFNELESFLQSQMPGYTVKPVGSNLIHCTKDAVLAQIKWESKSIVVINTDLNMKHISNILLVALPAGIGAAMGGFLVAAIASLSGVLLAKLISQSAVDQCKQQLKSLMASKYERVE